MSSELVVPDASCGHCKETIESTVMSLDGVTSAGLDLDSKRLVVDHDDRVSQSVLVEAVSAAGYNPKVPS